MSCGSLDARSRGMSLVACLVEGRQDNLWFGERYESGICQPPRGLPTYNWGRSRVRSGPSLFSWIALS